MGLSNLLEGGQAKRAKKIKMVGRHLNLKILIKKILGFALINDSRIPCGGEIKVLKVDRQHKTAYVSWQVVDENGQLLASKSRNYFLDKEKLTETDIVEAVLDNILKYRMGRVHLFSELKIV